LLGVTQISAISEELCKNLRKVLKDHREAAELSLNELAKRSGLNRMAISFIEKGQRIPSTDTVIRLAAALGLPPSQLFLEAEEKGKSRNWIEMAEKLAKAKVKQ
jgi:transcriptional regulator with XRE-family HTH domain